MSPTASSPTAAHAGHAGDSAVGEGCTRGGGDGWVGPGGLYRYPGPTRPGPRISLYLVLRPYPRPNEGEFHGLYEVS